MKDSAATGSGERPPEVRVKKLDNNGKISFGFTVKLDVPEITFDDEKTDPKERRLQEEAKKKITKNLIEVFAVKEEGDEADENN